MKTMSHLSLRTWAERLSRGKWFWRRLPAEFGRAPICISPDAALQLLKPGKMAFDPMLLRFCKEFVKKGGVVWDIGANLGIFSLASAARNARVLAMEPDPWLYNLVSRTIRHKKNRNLQLEILQVAIAEHCGVAHLAIANRGRSSNYLKQFHGRTQTGGVRETILVPLLTLDVILQDMPAPSVVKIDVEGAEAAVLEGGKRLLEVARPVLLVEVGRETWPAVAATLTRHDYALFDYEQANRPVTAQEAVSNVLAVPR